MGYLQGLVNVSFRKDNAGSTIFFPNGKFGKGYIISSAEEEKIKTFLRRYYTVSFTSLIIVILMFSSYVLLLAGVLIIWYYIRINKILDRTKKSPERGPIRESIEIMSVSMGLPTCLVLFLSGALLLVASIIVFIRNDKMWGGLGIVFSGFALIVLFKMLMISIKNKKPLGK